MMFGRAPTPPRFYLRHCHVITRPHGWITLTALTFELRDLAPDAYRDLSPPLAGAWLADNNIPVTTRNLDDTDDQETPGVSWHDIDTEIKNRVNKPRR